MSDEDAFLRKLLENPADDTVRLVYADWLDERSEAAKAEFLRLTAEEPRMKKRRKSVGKRLQMLAAELDRKWLAVVSKLLIEVCESGGSTVGFGWKRKSSNPTYLCPKKWEQLRPTDTVDVRFCTGCQSEVYFADTIATAHSHAASGRCVVVSLGVVRSRDDLVRWDAMGRFAPEVLDREEERRRLGEVSAGDDDPD
jgi:uncharacterized protein (TIGR02996 family)